MGKKAKEMGVKRKRGKKFELKEELAFDVKRKINAKSMFRDKRLGEKNPNLDKEQKSLMRYQKERDFLSRRKQRFELDDTIELTHKGMRLEDLQDDYVEDYDLDLSDDEPKMRKLQRMDDDVVLEHHFGDGTTRSKKSAYEELIQKSKQNKMIRQQEKEDNFEVTKRLDEDLADITGRLKFKNRDRDRGVEIDEYDNLLLEIRDDAKVQAELNRDDFPARQIREKFEANGENWAVPLGYKEFVVRVRENPNVSMGNMKIWTDCDTKKEKIINQDRLLEFALRFMIFEIDDTTEECVGEFDFFTETLYELGKTSPQSAERVFTSAVVDLGKNLTIGVVYFYHLVSLLFPITFEDSLTGTLSILAECFFIEYPLASYKCTRNLLILVKVYTECWLVDKYCPEVTRCLQRVMQQYKVEKPAEDFKVLNIWESESSEGIYAYALSLFHSQKELFSDYVCFKEIWKNFIEIAETSKPAPMQLLKKPIEEIATYEPLVYGKIKSGKKNKDPNKEASELDKLREQSKRAKKLTKRALEKETEQTHHEKGSEYSLTQANKQSHQNYVKNMLDELQVEYKRFDTSLERRDEKKKRKKRMGGNKTEKSSR